MLTADRRAELPGLLKSPLAATLVNSVSVSVPRLRDRLDSSPRQHATNNAHQVRNNHGAHYDVDMLIRGSSTLKAFDVLTRSVGLRCPISAIRKKTCHLT
jgi:hypothetical protein